MKLGFRDTRETIHTRILCKYGVRTKAGKKQSSEEDAGVKIAHSAGVSIRRHNELALNKWDR
ncbi:hypothetical protein HanXRQr2_Chr13g0616181 [Helianthus annuus]|uniref:VLRF1 domain-containing protein n=1 Tax=Helianthus annuus TaxID=4232 RepID=A0A9K3ELF4_HELAN|nr:hypothetical protein HanXRQr2_Chr13g0616181 [Helianthus annuus]